jgi:dihydrolipoamide dehydrogenase
MGRKIAIVGAGPGGYVAAVRAAQNGAEVTVVEKAAVGGTCLNRGCIPSKILKVSAEMMETLHRAESYGIRGATGICVDMPALMSRKEKIVKTQVKGIEALLSHHNIELITGDGYIPDQGVLTVNQAGGHVRTVPWERLIISTGTEPLPIPAFPFDGRQILSSNEALG